MFEGDLGVSSQDIHFVTNEFGKLYFRSNVMQKRNVKGRSQAVVELVRLGELKI